MFPDITNFEHGIEIVSAENPCNIVFLTKSVHNVLFIICKFQLSLRSPKHKSVFRKFAGCSTKKLDALKNGVMFSFKFHITYWVIVIIYIKSLK